MIACAIVGRAPYYALKIVFTRPPRLHSGCCRCVIGAECSIMGQQRPHDPGILVRQCHRRYIRVTPGHQFSQPAFRFCFVLGKLEHRSGSVDHQGAQVGVAAFADAQQSLLAAAGALFGTRPIHAAS